MTREVRSRECQTSVKIVLSDPFCRVYRLEQPIAVLRTIATLLGASDLLLANKYYLRSVVVRHIFVCQAEQNNSRASA